MSEPSENHVLVIGASGLDVVSRLDGVLRPGTSNPANIRTSFGGVARNVAENLARLGQPVKLLTVIGRDRLGEEILAQEDRKLKHDSDRKVHLHKIARETPSTFTVV